MTEEANLPGKTRWETEQYRQDHGHRAAWLGDVRHILAALEAHPELPVPVTSADTAVFILTGTIGYPGAPQILAVAEDTLARSLHVTFTTRAQRADQPLYYVLTATLESGLRVEIHAWARSVAIPVPTGTWAGVTWVRKSADTGEAAA